MLPVTFQPGTVGKVTHNRIRLTSYLRVDDFSTLKATNVSKKNSKNLKDTAHMRGWEVSVPRVSSPQSDLATPHHPGRTPWRFVETGKRKLRSVQKRGGPGVATTVLRKNRVGGRSLPVRTHGEPPGKTVSGHPETARMPSSRGGKLCRETRASSRLSERKKRGMFCGHTADLREGHRVPAEGPAGAENPARR